MSAFYLPWRTFYCLGFILFSFDSPDVEMADGSKSMGTLKPVGGIGKKLKKKFKVGKGKRHGKGKLRRKRNI